VVDLGALPDDYLPIVVQILQYTGAARAQLTKRKERSISWKMILLSSKRLSGTVR
jgi:hypothetical protein